MDIVVPKHALQALLERAYPISDKKAAVPALANALLAAEGTTLRVSATDLYLAVSGECECEVSTPGSIAAPAKDLFERVGAMPDGPVQISVEPNSARVTVKAVGQARRYTLHGLPGKDFPLLPKPTEDAFKVELPVGLFALLMHRTHFSISTDETRAHVNSAMLEIQGETVRMVSTDGHRLTLAEARHSGLDVRLAETLLTLKAIGELRRIMDHARAAKVATFTLQVHGPTAFFTVGGTQFSVKLVDAQFPPYGQVIPSVPAQHPVRVNRLKFIDVIKAIRIAASDRTGGVVFTFKKGAIVLTSESPESGNAFDQVDADYEGPEIRTGFNAKYLLDALGAIEDEEVVIWATGELDPICVLPGGEDKLSAFQGVVMPLRVT